MEAIKSFALAKHNGPYESWPLETEVLKTGIPTKRKLPGYILEGQFQHRDFYVFVTSWDCMFEESLEIVLTDSDLNVLDRQSIGAMYSATWLESCEVVRDEALLLQCDGGLRVHITLVSGQLQLEKTFAVSSERK
jgi:hypothetical protein